MANEKPQMRAGWGLRASLTLTADGEAPLEQLYGELPPTPTQASDGDMGQHAPDRRVPESLQTSAPRAGLGLFDTQDAQEAAVCHDSGTYSGHTPPAYTAYGSQHHGGQA